MTWGRIILINLMRRLSGCQRYGGKAPAKTRFSSHPPAVAGYLKLLKDARLPALGPGVGSTKAAGKWFWWGKDAASHKAMAGIVMFNYFIDLINGQRDDLAAPRDHNFYRPVR